ncbi:histone-lysine N-methyltransferase, H3 lysine-9 specific SUVH4-like [Rutidosis leptorrhynchoides]|uniref:histone-lysine N-methyltransferase, H3 lysine-9 specific SUVH4-like n=1 Tax=Rutidosis leptorrhynchoides TaxID=125765 RepID=UPI003A9A1832
MVVIQMTDSPSPTTASVTDTENCFPMRRTSSRIKKLADKKKELRRRRKEEEALTKASKPKKQRISYGKKKVEDESVLSELVKLDGIGNDVVVSGVVGEEIVKGGEMVELTGSICKAKGDENKSDYAKVKDTIRAFYAQFLHFVQLEEQRCKKEEDDDKKKPKKDDKKKSKKDDKKKPTKDVSKAEGEERSKAKRPDLKALKEMMETKTINVPESRIGSIPGVDVGHQFFSRCEMVTVGFHNHWLNGIDYIGSSSKAKYPGYTLPITVAIVMSGQYEDDHDNCEDVIYTGQGGNNLLGDKKQIKDQVMERGNLGLKHSQEQNVPVRVIRGHQSKTSYVGKVYTYDGLYKVVNNWTEKGKSGFTVFKFKLKRLDGQPPLLTEQVYFSRSRIPNTVSELAGLVCADISGGLENIPVPATNLVDDPPVPPTGCTYINSMQVSKNVVVPSNAPGCKCVGNCTASRSCACAVLNKGDFAYVHRDGGRLIEPKSVVYECGPNCGCGPGCINKTSQKGLRYRLEVYKTPKKGWAVRSWDFIPSGAPVCEYIGVLKKTDDVDSNPENNYIFDMDCLETMQGLNGREKRIGEVDVPQVKDIRKDSGPEFCIDAGTTGNVARYINHSCQPNLFVQSVLSAHHDPTQARIILFAADNIPPLKELTYDYGYELNSVLGPDGEIKQLACYCGAPDCRKRLF